MQAGQTTKPRSLRLKIEVGAAPGTWIGLRANKTIIGESGIEWMMVEYTENDSLLLCALDPTTLVTLNHDPLPPTPIGIQADDVIGVSDYTMRLVRAV